MFEIEVNDTFKITGRGFVVVGEIIKNETTLKNGDILINREDNEQKIYVNAVEMTSYGARLRKDLRSMGFLTEISEEAAKSLIGKRLYKE
ncbi:hypothetical protein [Paenibacillus fonticola]|uniref:hypothetical protein n=1 Tax=Paenibacillus fonticola TaxID=379896 RepID=UPI0003784B29|nr:hypothetical protein [Paenibacillus fonticola]